MLRHTEYATAICDEVGENGEGMGCTAALISWSPAASPARHRATSASLRVFEIAGRRPSTAYPWRSMAFRISCPPRLNNSMSTASSRSTLLDQRQALLKPLRARAPPRTASSRRMPACCGPAEISSSLTPMTAQVFERKIDSSLGIVVAHVLPEIGQLQRGTGEIRKGLPIGIAISAEIENQMAHRIRRVAAVAQQVFEAFRSA